MLVMLNFLYSYFALQVLQLEVSMRIAGMKHTSTSDGPGSRFVVLLQGCEHKCPGCWNPDAQDTGGGVDFPMEELTEQMLANPTTDGLSFAGGEPFGQAADCAALARAAHQAGLNVWCWTGYTLETLLSTASDAQLELLREIDVLVDGPFILDEYTSELPWRTSRNQRLLRGAESLAAGKAILWEA